MKVDNQLPAINPESEIEKIVTFISTTFKEQGKTKAVVAVSGGIDSATSLALSTKAIGPENVHVLLLPSNESSEKNTADGALLAELYKIPEKNVHEINIGALQDIAKQTVTFYGKGEITPARVGNIAARLRMIMLFDQAMAHDALVIGTENKSEHYLGYFTRFGDEASDIEPLRHLYKTQVYALAVGLNVPQAIIKKAPSAGLWADQTDEAEFGFSYIHADPILYFYYDQKKTKEEIIALGYSKELVDKVLTYSAKSAFKHLVPYHLQKHNATK